MNTPVGFSYTQRDLRVVFANGALRGLNDVIGEEFGPSGCFLISTPGRTATIATARVALGSRVVGVFEGARPHVPTDSVEESLEAVRTSVPDCLVTIGGGSAIGLGKVLAMETGLPLVAVPTTYSGSEMTDIWGVTDHKGKRTGRDRRAAARLVVYDPQLTYTMPPHVTGSSGVNAIAHGVEGLYAPDRSPVSTVFAMEGVRLLATNLPILVGEPAHPGARWEALKGAHFCGRTLDMTTMGLHHKLCHTLGGTLGLPHAMTHAVVLPYVASYNAASAPDAMETVAVILDAESAHQGLCELNHTLGITQTLGDLGMASADIGQIADLVVTGSHPNPATVTTTGVRQLLERAIAGDPPE